MANVSASGSTKSGSIGAPSLAELLQALLADYKTLFELDAVTLALVDPQYEAARLLAEGEARIAAAGHDAAWLHCSIGNDHAARFYERAGWHLAETEHAAFGDGDAWVSLDILVYRKRLKQPAG